MEETDTSRTQEGRPGSAPKQQNSIKQSNVAAQPKQPAQGGPTLGLVASGSNNEPELGSREWYNQQAKGKSTRNLNLNTIWPGLGVDDDPELIQRITATAQSLIDSNLARLKLRKGKKSPEMENAVRKMDNTFKDTILRRRRYCTQEFRDSSWYKLIRSKRYEHPEYRSGNPEESDDTYREEDSIADSQDSHYNGAPANRTANRPAATARMMPISRPASTLNQRRQGLEPNQNAENARCRAFESATPDPTLGSSFGNLAKLPVRNSSKENMIDGLADTSSGKNSRKTPGKSVHDTPAKRGVEQYLSPKGKPNSGKADDRRVVSFKESVTANSEPGKTLKRPRSISGSGKRPDVTETPSKKAKGLDKATFTDLRNLDLDADDFDTMDLPEVEEIFRGMSPKTADTPSKTSRTYTKENDLRQKSRDSTTPSRTEQSAATTNQVTEADTSRQELQAQNNDPNVPQSKASCDKNTPGETTAKPSPRRNSRIIAGFIPTVIEPHGEVRLGYFLPNGDYTVLHEGEFSDEDVEDIFNQFATSTDAVLTGMELKLRDTCAIRDLRIPKARVPRKRPYDQLEEFLMQSALRERSQSGLDFVVAPVAVADFYKRRQKA